MATYAPQSEKTELSMRTVSPGVAIAALLLVALALRIGLALAYPTLDWPDEVFQTTEPAHRLAFGSGIVTWEWREGVRNWAFPGMLAGIMRLTSWMAAGSAGYVRAISVVLALVSLIVVWVAYRWGSRQFGASPGLAAAASCALSYELIYYAPKPLTEAMAAHLMLGGLYLGYWSDHLSRPARLLAGGVLLGLAVGLRVQLGPAIAVGMVFMLFRLPRRLWTPLLLGAALTLLAFGLLDGVTWSRPFVSYYRIASVNILAGKAAHYGVQPWDWYFGQLLVRVSWLLPLALWGARRNPMLAAVTATVLASHSAIAHKEYRYVYPAVVLILFLAALAVAEAAEFCRRRVHRRAPAITTGLLLALLMGAMLVGSGYAAHIRTRYDGALPAFRALSSDSTMCGLGLRGPWFWSGGYTYLHRDVPIVPLKDNAALAAASAAFNVVVTSDGASGDPPGFTLQDQWGYVFLYRREGGCAPPAPGATVNEVLKAHGD
jgi:phosphatidylinositol glycan class B